MTQALHALLSDAGIAVPPGLLNPGLEAITSDSRRVGPGTLFLGLPGERVDGGSFWAQALAAGAAAAVIGPGAAAAHPPGADDPVVVIQEPVARRIGEIAAAFWDHPCRRMALIGVTGTNGKTTTTHLIEHLAASAGQSVGLFGTLVNRWPGHSITATHTTAFADLLQGQLAEAASAGCGLWTSHPVAMVLGGLAVLFSFGRLLRTRRVWQRLMWALASLSGLLLLGLQPAVERLSDAPWNPLFWQSHFWMGLLLGALLLSSVVIQHGIKTSPVLRNVHISTNIVVALLLAMQAISGTRNLLIS